MLSNARTKVLQISTLRAVRSMRAVLCGVLRQGSSSDPLARSSPDHRGAFQAALNAFVAEERALEDLGGLTDSTGLQKGFYAHLGQADRPLSANRVSKDLVSLPLYQRPAGVPRIDPSACVYAGVRYMVVRVMGLECSKRPTPSEYRHPYARSCIWTPENPPSSRHSGE
jgi:hypothetical protein